MSKGNLWEESEIEELLLVKVSPESVRREREVGRSWRVDERKQNLGDKRGRGTYVYGLSIRVDD